MKTTNNNDSHLLTTPFSPLTILAVLFLLCGGLFAQEQESDIVSSFRLDESGRILQRISWIRSNAYFYEVEIEQQTGTEEWQPMDRQRTEELFLEVSLPPGMYRYRILSYNVLGRVAAASDWSGIRVFATKEPLIERTIPEAYHVDNLETEFTLVLEGANLMRDADVYLIAKTERAARIIPRSVQYREDEGAVTLVIRTAGLELGPYDIVLTNPGRLQTVYEGFTFRFRELVDVNVSLGYAPFLPLYGYLFETYSGALYPAGFYGRISVVPFKRFWGFLGAEFTPRFADMTTQTDRYKVRGTMWSFALNGLYQWWFNDRTMALNFRLGGGLAMITDIRYEHKDGSASEDVSTLLPMVNAGVSLEWLVWQDLFAEGGLEYSHLFSSLSPAPGLLKLMLGTGWRF
ncbi:MAG: hypothetical protein LBQ57_09310 [Spirochaetales bacterium]|jgi:hypothetical protein|nr:hypothetical protein [Spirochaetales bacterium]